MIFGEGVKYALAFVLASVFLVVIIEGLSSMTVSIRQMLRDPPLSSPSRYDEILGWTSIPSTYYPDFYGPGKYVRTNSQGYRNDAETNNQVQRGKLRIICSGDSFTYGQGVANNHTWCHRLSELDDKIETVNLGQPGYGVDQIYLRYLRDGAQLHQSIHIFAFVSGDFNRMGKLHQHGHGKPIIELDNDRLVTTNVPVPRFRWWISRGVDRADFRAIDLAQSVLVKLSPPKTTKPDSTAIKPVASKAFQSLQQLSTKKNIVSVFVYLPTETEIGKETAWRQWAASTVNDLPSPFIDLTPALRQLPAPLLTTFFIPEGRPGAGHYTEAGNKWVAEELYKSLMKLPRIQSLVEKATAAGSEAID